MKKTYLKEGFTLIELLVVIAIIGVLTTLLFANYTSVRSRARDVQRKSDLNQIKRALRLYYNDQTPTAYPAAAIVNFGNTWAAGTMVYMKLIPQDPQPPQVYHYSLVAGSQDFCLWGTLENQADGDIAKSKSRCSSCSVGSYDYVVCAD